MRKPKPEEKVRCPKAANGQTSTPTKVWDDGSYGVQGPHMHGMGPECEYSHFPVAIVKPEKK